MELSEDLLQQIEAFLDGKLSKEAKENFELRMAGEPLLKEAVEAQRRLRNAMEILKMKEKLKHAYVQFEDQTKRRPLNRPVWQTYAVAASIVFIMVSVAYFATDLFKSDTEVAFNAYYRPESAARGECPQDLNGFELYEQKQYEEALFKARSLKDDSTHCVAYFIGINQLALAALPKAIESLQTARASSNAIIVRKAEWYLGLAYLRANDEKNAQRIFESIVEKNDPGNPYLPSATKILDRFFK